MAKLCQNNDVKCYWRIPCSVKNLLEASLQGPAFCTMCTSGVCVLRASLANTPSQDTFVMVLTLYQQTVRNNPDTFMMEVVRLKLT